VLLFDILLATLVLFPFLTEGFGVALPGSGFVSLPDLGVPLLVAALVAAGVRWSSAPGVRGRLAAYGANVSHVLSRALPRTREETLRGSLMLLGALALGYATWRHWAYDKPGFGLSFVVWSMTRGTGAVLLVALAGIAIREATREPWERSFFFRAGRGLGRAWLRLVERAPARALWGAAFLVGLLFLAVAIVRHLAFDTHGFDLGIFTNVLWNLTHGHGYVSSVKGGINLFIDHQSPLLWAFAPLFAAAPRPETLLVAQAFGLAAGGPALYYLSRARFGAGHWAPAALPWLYWCYLPLRNANAFDFHPEVFMLPLFLWSFAAFASRSALARAFGVAAFVAALGAKESAGVVAAGLGAGIALTRAAESWRRAWPGVLLALAGAAVFFFDVKVVPGLFGREYPYLNLYQRFGGGLADLLLAPFTQPVYFFSQLLDHERVNFLFWTLAPLGFLPLVAWRAAAAALPPYLMLLLSEGDQRVRIVFHYGIEPACALFWALPFGLAAAAARFGWSRTGVWLLVWAAAALGPGEIGRIRDYEPTKHQRWLAREAMPCIDPQAPTAASDVLVPHLATRVWVSYPYALKTTSGEPVSCVVTDLDLGTWPLLSSELQEVLDELPARGYRRALQCGRFSVYERAGASCLRCTPRCP
jgi:uncharacterized membrane protein